MKPNLDNIGKNETLRKITYKCFSILIYIIISIILICLLINRLTNKEIFGYEAFIITSESMEPKIKTGDIVVIKHVLENDIKQGDIITFEKNNEYITHRVVKIEDIENKKRYTTKGDNNKVNDSGKIEYSQIKGVKVITIPLVGKLVLKVANEKGVIVVLIFIILLYIRAKKIDKKKIKRRKKKKIEDEKYFKNQENQ